MPSEEEIAQQLYQLLWERHVSGEWPWLILALLSPLIGLLFYIGVLRGRNWWGHLQGLLDALYFYISPFAPRYMVIAGDVDGYHIDYDLKAFAGKDGWTVNVRGKEYLVPGDPRKFSRPTSLWGMKPPEGSGPFHAAVALVIGWLISIAMAVTAMTQTAWITMVAFDQPPTTIDVVVLLVLVGTVIWALRNIFQIEATTGLFLALTRVPPGNLAVPSDPSPENVSSWARLVFESLGRKWDPAEEVRKAIDKLREYLGDKIDDWSAATIIAEAKAAFTFREKLSYLEETLDEHVEILESQYLRQPEERHSRVIRWGPWIAIIAVILALVGIYLALGVSVEPASSSTVTQTVANVTSTPAFPTPPSPPGGTPTVTPASPAVPPVTTPPSFATPPLPPG